MADLNDPALTYTLDDFVESGDSDEMTYDHFAIINHSNQNYTQAQTNIGDQNIIKFAVTDVLDEYLDLFKICDDKDTGVVGASIKVTEFTMDEIAKYKYHPDLLAYDIYGTTQLDFLIMLVNGIIDPKEFDFKRGYLILPKKSAMKNMLSQIKNGEKNWIETGDSI